MKLISFWTDIINGRETMLLSHTIYKYYNIKKRRKGQNIMGYAGIIDCQWCYYKFSLGIKILIRVE